MQLKTCRSGCGPRPALRDDLTIEMGELLDQPDVLEFRGQVINVLLA